MKRYIRPLNILKNDSPFPSLFTEGSRKKTCCRNDQGRHRHVVSNFPVSCQQMRKEEKKYYSSIATVRPICSYLSVLTDIRQWRVRIVYGASIWREQKRRSERERRSTHACFFSFFFVCWLGFFWRRVHLELSCALCSCTLGNLAVPSFMCVLLDPMVLNASHHHYLQFGDETKREHRKSMSLSRT